MSGYKPYRRAWQRLVIPQRVRRKGLYPGQILTLAIEDRQVIVSTGDKQVRCSACGSELDVRKVLPNVHLCTTCRDSSNRQQASQKSVTIPRVVWFVENEKLDKQHVRTLTTGWRLTLPAQLRRALGWEQGTMLRVTVTGDQLALSKGADVPQGSPQVTVIRVQPVILGPVGR